MKQIISFFLFLFCFSQLLKAAESDSLILSRYQAIQQEVKAEFAPDKRIDIFNVSVVDGAIEVETTRKDALERFRSLIKKESGSPALVEKLLPATELGEKVFGIVRLSVANHRQEPGHSAEMVTQSLLGTPLQILKKQRGYYLVRTPDRYISWLSAEELTAVTAAEMEAWKQAKRAVYLPEYGHSFSEPSEKSRRVSDLVSGNLLEIIGKNKKFAKVKYPDDRIAWILEKDLMPIDKWLSRPLPDAGDVLETAYKFLGVPYLWGGTSAKGMDCSGFTKTCYFLNGIQLSRDASQQALYGEKIDIFENDSLSIEKCLANLKPGDLLFFASGRAKNLNARVTHTAIYIGDGEFIQAAGLIRVNSMKKEAHNYADFQSRTIVGARRILTAVGTTGISRVGQNEIYKTASR